MQVEDAYKIVSCVVCKITKVISLTILSWRLFFFNFKTFLLFLFILLWTVYKIFIHCIFFLQCLYYVACNNHFTWYLVFNRNALLWHLFYKFLLTANLCRIWISECIFCFMPLFDLNLFYKLYNRVTSFYTAVLLSLRNIFHFNLIFL